MATNTEPAWYQKMLSAQAKNEYIWEQDMDTVTAPGGPYTFRGEEPERNGISLNAAGEEMMRCSKEGFWVRGVKVAQDDKEAEAVYNAFKQWLTWASLADTK